MKKATRIMYDPYKNKIDFRIAQSVEGPWKELGENSALLYYTNGQVLFSNCAEDIIEEINEKQNSESEGLEIQFIGTDEDYLILEKTIAEINRKSRKHGELSCKQVGKYRSADESIEIIQNQFAKIAAEFEDYLPGHDKYESGKELGDTIVRFNEIISDEIPICVIGNYSVGKSAFINALIGDEILPSKANPSTAKNVRVVRSEECHLIIEYMEDENSYYFDFQIIDNSMTVYSAGNGSSAKAEYVCKWIFNQIDGSSKRSTEILHDALDVLNNKAETSGEDNEIDPRENIGWNLTIEVPFASSVLTSSDAKIVLYDTPGSDNSDIDQKAHREALEKLMTEQTNALPILVTSRDRALTNDNLEIKTLLDQYKDNFANPNCLIVVSKGDLLTNSQLEEDVPAAIRSWHGKSTVLFTTPVGAIGERKADKSVWHNSSYEEAYDDWKEKVGRAKKSIVLPKYNIIPCQGRDIVDAQTISSPELFATGIPSVECEILYYIKNYANYKKCVRGREDLLNALKCMNKELDHRRNAAAVAKNTAEKKRATEKKNLLEQLDAVQVQNLDIAGDGIAAQYQMELQKYCDDLSAVMHEIYDKIESKNPTEMDDQFDKEVRDHCQRHLVDENYLGKDGIQNRIITAAMDSAGVFADGLHEYVDRNDTRLSESARTALHQYLDLEVKPPKFPEVPGVLGDIDELFGKARLVSFEIEKKLTKNAEKARDHWIDAERKIFVKRLNDGKDLFNRSGHGLFRKAAIDAPIERYYTELVKWAEEYRRNIKNELDQHNAVLSGMEDEINELDARVKDLTERIQALAGVEDTLNSLLDEIM